MAAANRSATREAVIQAVFEVEFRELTDERDIALATALEQIEHEVGHLDRPFAEQLFAQVFEKIDAIKELLVMHAPDWPYEKIARLDRAILLAAIAELQFMDGEHIPHAVTLNEYVEITKNYGEDSDRRFVNGVLSTLKKELKPAHD